MPGSSTIIDVVHLASSHLNTTRKVLLSHWHLLLTRDIDTLWLDRKGPVSNGGSFVICIKVMNMTNPVKKHSHKAYVKGCEECKQLKLKERIKRGDIEVERTHTYKNLAKEYKYPKTTDDWMRLDADRFWWFLLAETYTEV